jgi:thiaminase/transcriptional activator TenA
MSDRFTDELWQGAADIYGAILAHPFLAGLTDGSLEQDAFTFYVVQDTLYLRAYAQALAAVASGAPDTAGTELFARHAAEVITVERTLHDSLLGDLGIDPASADTAGKELLRRGSPNRRYQQWIDTYSAEEYAEVVRDVIAVADGLGPGLGPAERALVHRHFRTTSRYEWMFWDMGYRKEGWPV